MHGQKNIKTNHACSVIGLSCKLSLSAPFKFLIILYAFIWRPCKSCSILDTNVSQHCLLIFLVSVFTIATKLLYSVLSVSERVVHHHHHHHHHVPEGLGMFRVP